MVILRLLKGRHGIIACDRPYLSSIQHKILTLYMFVVDPSQMTLFGLESRSLELNHAFSQHLENDLRVAYYCRGFMLDEMKDMLV